MKKLNLLLGLAALTAMVTTATAQNWMTNGLVAYYPFNGTANDESGNGNNGTANNVLFASDRFGNAYSAAYFTGNSSSYVTINSTSLNLLPDFTVSAWVNFTAGVGIENPRFFSTAGYEIGANTTAADRTACFNNTTASSGAPTAYSANAIQAGLWNQVVGVRAGNDLLLYVNGSLAGSVSTTEPPDYSRGWLPAIGVNSGAYAQDNYGGALDDIRVYNRALSAGDVWQMYVSEVPEPSAALLGLSGLAVLLVRRSVKKGMGERV